MLKGAAVLAILVAGCTSYQPPEARSFEKTRVYDANFEKTWQAAVGFAAEKNFLIRTIEKASGIVAFEPARCDPSHCDCGTPGFTQRIDTCQATVNLFVRSEADDKTSVTVNTTIVGLFVTQDLGGDGREYTSWNPCVSTGVIEAMFLDGIGGRIEK